MSIDTPFSPESAIDVERRGLTGSHSFLVWSPSAIRILCTVCLQCSLCIRQCPTISSMRRQYRGSMECIVFVSQYIYSYNHPHTHLPFHPSGSMHFCPFMSSRHPKFVFTTYINIKVCLNLQHGVTLINPSSNFQSTYTL